MCWIPGRESLVWGAAVRAIANTRSGDLAEYLGVKALKPFIDSELVLAETIEFTIPGSTYNGRGVLAERFLEICQAYVAALSTNALSTDRQRR